MILPPPLSLSLFIVISKILRAIRPRKPRLESSYSSSSVSKSNFWEYMLPKKKSTEIKIRRLKCLFEMKASSRNRAQSIICRGEIKKVPQAQYCFDPKYHFPILFLACTAAVSLSLFLSAEYSRCVFLEFGMKKKRNDDSHSSLTYRNIRRPT